MPIIKQAISEVEECELVDISKFKDPKYRNRIGNTYKDKNGNTATINSKGVASHPGDLGMEMIANEIISALELNNDNRLKNEFSIKLSDINGKILNMISSETEIRFDTNQLSDEYVIIEILDKKEKVVFQGKIKIIDK